MGFIAELKRRNVIRMAGLYLVGAWLLLQVAGTVLPWFSVSASILRGLVIVLAIGLIPALIFAWVYEMTPDGLKRDAEVKPEQSIAPQTARRMERTILVLFAIALVYFAVDKFIVGRPAHKPADAVAIAVTKAAKTQERPSIAVLPFDNRSNVAEDAFFVDGMHDDILTQLSKISGLKVISRTSVEKFRDTKLSMREIAKQLGVKTILEGAVQRGGNQVRINMQLIDAETDAHVWAETYDRQLSAENIFAIQSEVTTAITKALKTQLTAGEKSKLQEIPTNSLKAWEAYQLGRQRMAKRDSLSLSQAVEYYRKSIDLDPKFTLAYVGLADATLLQISYSGADFESSIAFAENQIKTAMQLDQNSAEAWTTSGKIDEHLERFTQAERKFEKAIELNPNYVTAYHWYSNLLESVGRNDEALAMAQKAIALDPLSVIINIWLANLYEKYGSFNEALAQYQHALEIDPDNANTQFYKAIFLAYSLNRFSEAMPLVGNARQLDPGNPNITNMAAYMLFDLLEEELASRLLQEQSSKSSNNSDTLSLLTSMRLRQGDFIAAEKYARKLISIEPKAIWLLVDLLGSRNEYADALLLYKKARPELLKPELKVDQSNNDASIRLANVLKHNGNVAQAMRILASAESSLKHSSRLGLYGYGLQDVQIYAIRGDKTKATKALQSAYNQGWRGPDWQYYRDFDPSLASIRNEHEFKTVFAAIEKDMLRQRDSIRKQQNSDLKQ